MLIDPTVNLIYATHSLLSNFKKATVDPEVLKDIGEQMTGGVLKYVKSSIAIDAGSTDIMKGLRLSNSKRRLSDITEKMKNNSDLKTDEIQNSIKAIQEILLRVDTYLPNLTESITKSLNLITETSKQLAEHVAKVQSTPDRKLFQVLHEYHGKLLSTLDSFHLPPGASTKPTRLLETVKKIVSVELLSCIKGVRKSFKLVRQYPDVPKYTEEFTDSIRFLVSAQAEIDKLIRLLSESLSYE
jgi:hypothetical protein